MTTNTTRRAVMAGIAAAPVAGLPAIAGVVADDDPVFAAIAEHRRCKEIADAALAVYKGIGDDICAARDAIAIVRFDGWQYYNLSHLDRAVRLRGRLSGDKIAEFYNARAALEEHEPAFEKIWNESGLGKAEDAFEEMNGAYFGAEMALLSSRPTTQAGAMALLRFIPEHLEGPHVGAEDSEQRVATAIRAAVAVLEREARS